MRKSKHYKIHSLIQVHHESGHVGIGDRVREACTDLIDEERYNAASRAHNVSVSGTVENRSAIGCHLSVGVNDMLHHGLGNSHGVDRVSGLVGRQTDHMLDSALYGGVDQVIGTDDVGLHGLHREKFTARNFLECSGMEHIVNARHHVLNALSVTDVSYEKLNLMIVLGMERLKLMTHVILLFLIAGKDPDLSDVSRQEMVEHAVPETAGTSGYE